MTENNEFKIYSYMPAVVSCVGSLVILLLLWVFCPGLLVKQVLPYTTVANLNTYLMLIVLFVWRDQAPIGSLKVNADGIEILFKEQELSIPKSHIDRLSFSGFNRLQYTPADGEIFTLGTGRINAAAIKKAIETEMGVKL